MSSQLKLHIETKEFDRVWRLVAPAAPRKTPKPILQNVMLRATGGTNGKATLEATNCECGMIAEFQAEIKGEGLCLLSAEKVGQFLSASRSESLVLTSDGRDKIEIVGQKEKLKLSWTITDDYPTYPFAARCHVRMRSELLRTAIRCTQFATDVESSRYALGGICLDFPGGESAGHIVGTDGRRLAIAVVTLDDRDGDEWDKFGNVIIPLAALQHWLRILESSELCEISLDKSAAQLTCGTISTWSRMVEGRYPRWRDAAPAAASLKSTLTASAGDLESLCKLAMVSMSDESRGGDFRFAGDSLEIGKAADDSSMFSESSISVMGEGGAVSKLDLRFVHQAVSNFKPDEMVTVHLSSEGPNVFEAAGIKHIIMPLSRD